MHSNETFVIAEAIVEDLKGEVLTSSYCGYFLLIASLIIFVSLICVECDLFSRFYNCIRGRDRHGGRRFSQQAEKPIYVYSGR